MLAPVCMYVRVCEMLCVVKTAREIREASLKLCTRFIKTVDGMGVLPDFDIFNQIQNYAVAYGLFCKLVGIGREDALAFFIYSQTSALVTNCVKTIPLSQTDGQHMLHQLTEQFDVIIRKVLVLDESYLGLSMPAFDIRCMQHETLYSRLYMS